MRQKGVVWEKCQTVQDELNREHGLLKTLVYPRIQQSVVYFLACLQASQASLASVCGCQDDWSIERQPEGAGCSGESFHPSSLGTCGLSDAAVLEVEYDPWLFSLTSQESQVWSLLEQEYSWNRLPSPIPLGRPFEKYHHMGSRRASSDRSIWTSALHETRKQYCCSQEHKVKKINNEQSVTCVHKLPLSHMSMIKKFTEPTSTQTCCPCDTCRLTNRLRARSSHDSTKRKHQLPRSQLSAVERSTKVSGGRHI